MANLDFPSGLTPFDRDPLIEYFYASVTTAIFKGDIVAIKSTGRIHTLTTTTGDDEVIGVAAEYSKAGTTPAVKIAVYSDPNTRFIIQDDGTGGTTSNFGYKTVGECSAVVATTGDTTTGRSKQEYDISSSGSGATTDPLKIVGVYEGQDVQTGVSHCKFVCILNHHIKTKHRVGA